MKIPFLAFLIGAGLSASAQALVPILLADGHYQYQNINTGAVVFPVTFEEASPFHKGLAVVATGEHQYQMINAAGKPVAAGIWKELSPVPDGFVIGVDKEGGQTLLANGKKLYSTKGRLPGWSLAGDYINIQQKETGKMGVVNFRTGKEVLPPQYTHIRPFREGVAAVLANGSWQFVDVSGKALFPQQFEDAGVFSEGFAAARTGGKWGFINKKGAWVIPAQYERVTAFEKGSAFAKTAQGWQQIDGTGKTLRTLPYQMVITPTEGLYAFMQNDQWGYAEAATGKVIITPQYLRAAPFEEGVALVAKDGANFYILPDGRELRTLKKGE